MATRESSSPVDLIMGDASQSFNEATSKSKRKKKTDRFDFGRREGNGGGIYVDEGEGVDDDEEEEEEECDSEVCEMLGKSFREVQSVLDQNRSLIQQVKENHHSKIPDNLVQNVALIREINGNISKVMSMYTDLSVNFSNVVQQHRLNAASKNGKKESNGRKRVEEDYE